MSCADWRRQSEPVRWQVIATRPGPAGRVLAHRAASVDDVVPDEGSVVVEMSHATVNPSDLLTIAGVYRSRTSFPFVPGFEGVGTVVTTGRAARSLCGTRVLPIGSAGTWQSHKVASSRWCIEVPQWMPSHAAAFAYVNPLTALHLTRRVADVDACVVLGASSVTAEHLRSLLRRRGIEVVGVCRRRDDIERLRAHGWRVVVASEDRGWWSAVSHAVAGHRAVAVLDGVGGAIADAVVVELSRLDRFVSFGLSSGQPLTAATWRALRGKGEFFHLRHVVHAASVLERHAMFRELFAEHAAGSFMIPDIEQVTPKDLAQRLREPPRSGTKLLLHCR